MRTGVNCVIRPFQNGVQVLPASGYFKAIAGCVEGKKLFYVFRVEILLNV